MERQRQDADKWIRQLVGAVAGGILGYALTELFPQATARLNQVTVILWFAAFFAMLTSLSAFIKAGAALTRSSNRWLNLLVGLGIPVLLLGILFFLFAR